MQELSNTTIDLIGRSNSNENDEPSRSPSAFVPVTAHFQKSMLIENV